MKLGDVVVIDRVYRRMTRYRPHQGNGHTWNTTVKVWESVPIQSRTAIYLGKRTLWNGTRIWEDEVGNVFEPEEHFQAMLVCFSTTENPVYVPWEPEMHG